MASAPEIKLIHRNTKNFFLIQNYYFKTTKVRKRIKSWELVVQKIENIRIIPP